MSDALQPGYDLIITNGDSAGELLRKAFTGTEVLPWRDVLHDGPVPLTDDLEELSEQRADFLAERGWSDPDTVRENFRARDRGLAHYEAFETVTLWFEHDLYDQLQLIQILDWFFGTPGRGAGLQLVQSDDFLGTQSVEQLAGLVKLSAPVSEVQLALASKVWSAFRQPEPSAFAKLLSEDLSALPYMEQAVRRMLQELPDANTGLARTQHQILVAINDGVTSPRDLFGAVERMEEAAFMGDWSFWAWLDGLALSPGQLIEGLESSFAPEMGHDAFMTYLKSTIALTPMGFQVLGGGEDYAKSARIDRWMGGTHVTDASLWRWNDRDSVIVAPVS
ncbi:MAG: DUF1835 domain-containing protein [Hyphomicrobiaceae bacterium]|nr:DUF1835 domain-containing protein [Hyphomicrobiaceae bacterium]